MNIKIVKSKKDSKLRLYRFTGEKIGEFDDSPQYDFLFQNNSNIAYVKGVFDRHGKFHVKKIHLKKEW